LDDDIEGIRDIRPDHAIREFPQRFAITQVVKREIPCAAELPGTAFTLPAQKRRGERQASYFF
jgi:hypothetical protein